MSQAIEHFSRHRIDDTMLQVLADAERDVGRLVEEEENVIRHYGRLQNWPHKRVNMFVFEDLRPLVAQIKNLAAVSSVVAEDIDNRPMVNVYDVSDLSECAVFVNRSALMRAGAWADKVALRALLAHEHGHPLAENATVHSARQLSLEVKPESSIVGLAITQILQLLALRLCVHAPQEVFANEIAIRAGFGDDLLQLDLGLVEKARLGIRERSTLAQGVERQVKEGKLSVDHAAALVLIGDLQGHLVFALETAAFLRAGQRRQAEAMEAALARDVWARLDPIAGRLYECLRDHYLRLRTDLAPVPLKAWTSEALASLAAGLRERKLAVRFELAQTRSRQPQEPPSVPIAARSATCEHGGGPS